MRGSLIPALTGAPLDPMHPGGLLRRYEGSGSLARWPGPGPHLQDLDLVAREVAPRLG